MDNTLPDSAGKLAQHLTFTGVRTHNLKNITSQIPLKKWIAVTGVSGSGKSSLVFDTIYSEAQRRFLETLGTYERQFLQGIPQGEFDEITNIPAAVALKQTNRSSDPRSVIASAADIAQPLQTLFISLMEESCTKCGNRVHLDKPQDLIDFLLSQEKGVFLITVPYLIHSSKGTDELSAQGYNRIVLQNNIFTFDEIQMDPPVKPGDDKSKPGDDKSKPGDDTVIYPLETQIVLDKISTATSPDEIKNRVHTLWSQIKFAPLFSYLNIIRLKDELTLLPEKKIFHVEAFCQTCNSQTKIIEVNDLNWQSILGYCKTCQGMGNIPILDENKIIPNPVLSLKEGAIKPWATKTFTWMNEELLRACQKRNIKITEPYSSLTQTVKDWIWHGRSLSSFCFSLSSPGLTEGTKLDPPVKPGDDKLKQKDDRENDFVTLDNFFEVLEQEKYKSTSRILLAKYRKYILCPTCQGARLAAAGRNALCFGKRYHDLFTSEISDVLDWLEKLKKEKKFSVKLNVLQENYAETYKKISLLVRLGLGSAHLFRRTKTLSGGEYQRVLLTRVIGNGLTDTLYILDEPSIGLGQNEIPTLISCIRELRDAGNTVLMVEHDKTLISAADEILELGPGGGKNGGELLVVQKKTPASFQNQFDLKKAGTKNKVTEERIFKKEESLFLKNFNALNCKNMNIEFLLGKLNVITGPSGAGKSTLLRFGLESALTKETQRDKKTQLTHNNNDADLDAGRGIWSDFIFPKDFFSSCNLVFVDQKAMHKSIASIPATVLGLMDFFRKKFSATSEAKNLGFELSDFSFNGAGGCECCGGKGTIEEDLFFLGMIEKTCPDCAGSRYRQDILQVKWHGKNIHEWLQTTFQECLHDLGVSSRATSLSSPGISLSSRGLTAGSILKTLALACELGLGHLPLGMATTTLSGGEAQRLRICAALCKSSEKIFCTLDEPTRGLSENDIGNLLTTLLRLCSEGHTFVVVEHHELFRIAAQHLIHLGPGSGIHGGKVVERFLCFSQF